MSPATYLNFALALTLCLAGGIVAVNSTVDPYGLARRPASPAAPAGIPVEDAGQFWRAVSAVREVRPRTVILGSSRARSGLDAGHQVFGADRQPVLNLALGGSSIDQMRLLLVHAHATAGTRSAVIGLDLESFVGPGRPDFDAGALAGNPESDPAWATRLRVALSRDMFWTAMTGLLPAGRAEVRPVRGRDAPVPTAPQDIETVIRGLDGQRGLIWVNEFHNFYSRLPYLFPYWAPRSAWNSDPRRAGAMKSFRELLAYARENGIELKLFISPVHARYLEWYRRVGWWPMFESWKRELAAAVDRETGARSPARAAIALWDFSGFHERAIEAVPRIGDVTSRMRWYQDTSHYTVPFGDLVLARMFSDQEAGPQLPGTPITASNVERILATAMSDAERYRLTHRAEVANVGQMVDYLRRVARK